MNPDDRIIRIEGKLDSLSDTLHAVDKTLVGQHASLAEHMRRTALAEESIDLIRKDLQPVKAHINRIDGGIRLVGFITLAVSLIGGILKIFSII